jgi:SAM-dependent methyltransferase
MNLTYSEIFKQRGNQYHDAMLRFPQARRAEFEQLFAQTGVAAGERVLDMPAGGGYLGRYLPADSELVSVELTPGFGTGLSVHDPAQPWPWGRFDHVVCLAALHHIEDQPGFIAGLLDRLQPGGTLHLADVAAGSGLVQFLDGFVGRFNITGHQGSYLRNDRGFFSALGDVARIGELDCSWEFASESDMLAFSAQLFGLVDCPPEALLQALQDHVGFERTDKGMRLNWRLLYVDLKAKKNRP